MIIFEVVTLFSGALDNLKITKYFTICSFQVEEMGGLG